MQGPLRINYLQLRDTLTRALVQGPLRINSLQLWDSLTRALVQGPLRINSLQLWDTLIIRIFSGHAVCYSRCDTEELLPGHIVCVNVYNSDVEVAMNACSMLASSSSSLLHVNNP